MTYDDVKWAVALLTRHRYEDVADFVQRRYEDDGSLHTTEEVRRALQLAEVRATTEQNVDRAAAIRETRQIIEEALLHG